VLFVNPRSGGGKAARSGPAKHARERGVEVVALNPDADLEALAADAVAGGADALASPVATARWRSSPTSG
jgi:hypothetical protein